MTRPIFITGGAGRIGRRILRQLLDHGRAVRVLVHRSEPEGVQGDGMTIVRGDIKDRSSFAEALDGCGCVCHLASVFDMLEGPKYETNNDLLFHNIIEGTYNLLDASRVAGVEQFVYASTDAVFTAIYKPHPEPITEEIELCPKTGRFYALAKATCESMCINYSKTYGLPCTIIRVGWCLDETDVLESFRYGFWSSLMLEPEAKRVLDRLGGDERAIVAPQFGDGTPAALQLGHAEDVATGFVLAMNRPEAAADQVFNIAGGEPYRYQDVVERVAIGLDKPWQAARIDSIHPYTISVDKARRLLGYAPRYDLAAMVEEALAGAGSS